MSLITPCLWFDSEAEEAARFYAGIFPDSKIGEISRYGEEGFEIHGRPAGSAMTVSAPNSCHRQAPAPVGPR